MGIYGPKGGIYRSITLAATTGDLETIRKLHESGVDILDINNHAMLTAAKNGHLSVVKYLREIDYCRITDDTIDIAARWSAVLGNLDMIKFLIESGADPHGEENIAVEIAANNGVLDMVEYLVSVGASANQALIGAAGGGRLDVVKYLVSIGSDIEIWDSMPIRKALEKGHMNVVRYLNGE